MDILGYYYFVVWLVGEWWWVFLLGVEYLILLVFGVYIGGLICDDLVFVVLVLCGLVIVCGLCLVVMLLGIVMCLCCGW